MSGQSPIPDGLVISATRYALGRSTYVVQETTHWLREHWHQLASGTRHVILRDVLQALTDGRVGMDCDRVEWERIADLAPTAEPQEGRQG